MLEPASVFFLSFKSWVDLSRRYSKPLNSVWPWDGEFTWPLSKVGHVASNDQGSSWVTIWIIWLMHYLIILWLTLEIPAEFRCAFHPSTWNPQQTHHKNPKKNGVLSLWVFSGIFETNDTSWNFSGSKFPHPLVWSELRANLFTTVGRNPKNIGA